MFPPFPCLSIYSQVVLAIGGPETSHLSLNAHRLLLKVITQEAAGCLTIEGVGKNHTLGWSQLPPWITLLPAPITGYEKALELQHPYTSHPPGEVILSTLRTLVCKVCFAFNLRRTPLVCKLIIHSQMRAGYWDLRFYHLIVLLALTKFPLPSECLGALGKE
jgi:hypothetical protein